MKPNYISRLVMIIIGITMMITGIRMLVIGVDAYVQPLHHTDWVIGSANITDISESVIKGTRKDRRVRINYSMTYEYEVNGMHYTGEFGPLANSIAVGKSIQIKYDPDAPENSTGFLSPSSSDLVLAVAGLILAVVGFFLSGIFGLIRRLIGKDHSDGKEEKGGISAEDAAYERKVKIVNTLRALFPRCPVKSTYAQKKQSCGIFISTGLQSSLNSNRKSGHPNGCPLVLALPIFPGRLQPSIVGRSELNFRVRDGNGWTLALISTNY